MQWLFGHLVHSAQIAGKIQIMLDLRYQLIFVTKEAVNRSLFPKTVSVILRVSEGEGELVRTFPKNKNESGTSSIDSLNSEA